MAFFFSFSILFFNLLLILPGDGGVGGSQKGKQTWKKQKGIVIRVHDAKLPEKSIKMLCEKILYIIYVFCYIMYNYYRIHYIYYLYYYVLYNFV